MNFLIYTSGQMLRFGIEDSKHVPNQSFLFLSFVLHIYIFAMKYNIMERKGSVHKTHLNKLSKSQSSPVLLEIWRMKDALEKSSGLLGNNLSIEDSINC